MAFAKLRKDDSIKNLIKNPAALQVYIYLLIHANYKDTFFKSGGFNIPKGSCFRTRQTIAKETGLTENQIRHQIDNLIKLGLVTKSYYGKYRIISVDFSFLDSEKAPNVLAEKAPNNSPNNSPHNKKEENKKNIINKEYEFENFSEQGVFK